MGAVVTCKRKIHQLAVRFPTSFCLFFSYEFSFHKTKETICQHGLFSSLLGLGMFKSFTVYSICKICKVKSAYEPSGPSGRSLSRYP